MIIIFVTSKLHRRPDQELSGTHSLGGRTNVININFNHNIYYIFKIYITAVSERLTEILYFKASQKV